MAGEFEYCERLVRQADKDRFLATLLAPAEKRPALFALYAFDLEIAGIGSRITEPFGGELRLQWWREVIEGARADEARASPVAAALCETLARSRWPPEVLLEFIDAHAIDLYPQPIKTLVSFEHYAQRTAGAVMQLAALALDPTSEAMPGDLAQHAGAAVALADALRHFASAASRRRLLVPTEMLGRHRVSADEIYAGRSTAGLLAALEDARSLAHDHLDKALSRVRMLPTAARVAFLPLTLVPLYLGRMERREYDPFATPIEVPQWRRQLRLWRTARAWLR
jgi:phytoene synthase